MLRARPSSAFGATRATDNAPPTGPPLNAVHAPSPRPPDMPLPLPSQGSAAQLEEHLLECAALKGDVTPSRVDRLVGVVLHLGRNVLTVRVDGVEER